MTERRDQSDFIREFDAIVLHFDDKVEHVACGNNRPVTPLDYPEDYAQAKHKVEAMVSSLVHRDIIDDSCPPLNMTTLLEAAVFATNGLRVTDDQLIGLIRDAHSKAVEEYRIYRGMDDPPARGVIEDYYE